MKAVWLSVLLSLAIASVAFVGPAAAQKKGKEARGGGGYAACKARMSKEPPCNGRWTRWCAAQCGSR